MALIRGLEIPPPSGNFHFGGGEAKTFSEVDWFRDDPDEICAPPDINTEDGRGQIAEFIKAKRYFNTAKAYLVLHQDCSFTIG